MTKNERATLEANFKAAWRAAIYAQESAKNPELTFPESTFEEDDAKGYRSACIDVLVYSSDGTSDATDKVQKWIDEAKQQAGATLTAGWMK
ncbi:hypothetical protein [Megasphaera sp.]|uniref:hypothetical protein n=1 Tax=Megasphaera sp. TaxID=2023260 RepID=UPI003522C629